jgi:hypothetical protein
MRRLRLLTALLLISSLAACGPSRRGGGGGGGGGGADDDDSSGDDDDAGTFGGSLAVVSPALSTTLPALVTRVRSDSGVSLTLVGGTDDCEGYSEVVTTSQEYAESYVAGEITLEEYYDLSVQVSTSYYGVGAWTATISLGSGEEWTTSAGFEPPFVQFGRIGDVWDSRTGVLSEGISNQGSFQGPIEGEFPDFVGSFQGEAIWSGGDFNGELLDFEFVGDAALCDVDVRSP